MSLESDALLNETNSQFIGAWKHMASHVPGHDIRETGGLVIANANAPLLVMNAAFLARPLGDAEDARRVAGTLIECFNDSEAGWIFPVCEPWALGDAGKALDQALTDAGLVAPMKFTGMAAPQLAPPSRPAPELKIRAVNDLETATAISDLNCIANHFPPEQGRASVTHAGFWSDPLFAYVGYVGRAAVSAAALVVVDGTAYIAWVATDENHRGKGYAEALMRHALACEERRSGIRRTTLHATDMGFPVYKRMGYEPVCKFNCWIKM